MDQHHYDEKAIQNDMNLQRIWCEILRPKVALLDFRLSWNKGQTEFFQGVLRYPIWGHPSGTDCRMEVMFPQKKNEADGTITYEMPPKRMYDHSIHEERMFHFNTIARVQLYVLFLVFSRGFECHDHSNISLKHRYRHDIKPDEVKTSYDHCYDCMSEIRVLHRYIQVMEQKRS